MKTRVYTVIYGEDVFCRATHSFEANHDGEAIAIALARDWGKTETVPDYDSAANPRIVNIEEGDRLVAYDIPLDIDEAHIADMRKRAAAKDLYDALVLARIELDRIFRLDSSEILRLVNAALAKAEGGAS